jgi:predicted DCC family thiol-disulfide oxidoreductase YuxK
MDSLTVIYDPDCGFCARARSLLADAPTHLRLEFLPYGSDEARSRYPGLCEGGAPELLAVDDAGGVYRDTKAYLMCMYATVAYRPLSLRLASPALLPLARSAFALLGRSRHLISYLLSLPSDSQMATAIRRSPAYTCRSAPAGSPPAVAPSGSEVPTVSGSPDRTQPR